MKKKILTLAIATVAFTIISCGTAHNNDNTNVDRTGTGNSSGNGSAADQNQSSNETHADSSGNNTGTPGVNYSKVKK